VEKAVRVWKIKEALDRGWMAIRKTVKKCKGKVKLLLSSG
jgi:hypothetical protein